ncbi:MAG: hypothetical protein ACI4R9_03675 [Kiritimatiellia bacterium]
MVDITVTFSGAENDVANADFSLVATNKATNAELSIASLTRNGKPSGSGTSWTQKFIWNAPNDVADGMVADIELSVAVTSGVQLWEDGPYWAACNVGASQPEESGHYFWWGDTVGYTRNANNDGWVSVKDGSPFAFSSGNCPTWGKNNSTLQQEGYIDATGNLVAAHHAATAYLGAPWRMPTAAEIDALIDNCTTIWTNRNGVYGRLVTGKGAYASKSIFLPAAGYGHNSSLYNLGSNGYYWSSTPNPDYSGSAWRLSFGSGDFSRDNNYRVGGRSVRPLRGFDSIGAIDAIGASTTFRLDLKHDGVRASTGEETLRFSNLWDGDANATVTISQNGMVLAEGLTGEGAQNWSVSRNGTYALTHTTYTNGVVAKVLNATFVVSGLDVPFLSGDIVTTGFSDQYDGLGHGISVTAPEGAEVRYALNAAGPYGTHPEFTNVCEAVKVWYEVTKEGYIPYTNSATVAIAKRPVTLTSGTKTDFVYDGQPHRFPALAVGRAGFVAGEGVATSNWATVTTVAEGEVANAFDFAPLEGTKLSNYDIVVVTGRIAVVKATVGGGNEPGTGTVPPGGISKWDVQFEYDGVAHTLDTNGLASAVADLGAGYTPAVDFSLQYAVGEEGVVPDSGWGVTPESFVNAGTNVVWYRISAANFEDFAHAVRVVITPRAISHATIAPIPGQTLDGTPCEPVPVVTDGTPSIITADDYLVSYSDNAQAGTATLTLTGTNNYAGMTSTTFAIVLPSAGLKAEIAWTYLKASGTYFAQIKVTCTNSLAAGIANLRYLFADRGDDVQLWDTPTRAAKSTTVVYGGETYRYVALDPALITAENAAAVYGVGTVGGDTIPVAERTIEMYVSKRVVPQTGNEGAAGVGDFVGYLSWESGGSEHAIPLVAGTSRVQSIMPSTLSAMGVSASDDLAAATSDVGQDAEAFVADRANTYDGFLCDANGQLQGTIKIKTSRRTVKKGVATVKASATVMDLNGRKWNYTRGLVDESGHVESLTCTKKGCPIPSFDVWLTHNDMMGFWGEYEVTGARNGMGLKGDAMMTALVSLKGTRQIDLEECSLTVKIGSRGVSRVTLKLSNGKKVSASSQLILIDGVGYLPIVIKARGEMPGAALILQIEESETTVYGESK